MGAEVSGAGRSGLGRQTGPRLSACVTPGSRGGCTPQECMTDCGRSQRAWKRVTNSRQDAGAYRYGRFPPRCTKEIAGSASWPLRAAKTSQWRDVHWLVFAFLALLSHLPAQKPYSGGVIPDSRLMCDKIGESEL